MLRKNGEALHSACALSPSTGSGRRLSKGPELSFCTLSLSKGGLEEAGLACRVARAGIEPATFHFSGERYYRLSYLAWSR
jgi:hypothetical protein